MQYLIITYVRKGRETSEEAAREMAWLVEDYLNQEWKLCGGLTVEKGVFYQAVTKIDTNT